MTDIGSSQFKMAGQPSGTLQDYIRSMLSTQKEARLESRGSPLKEIFGDLFSSIDFSKFAILPYKTDANEYLYLMMKDLVTNGSSNINPTEHVKNLVNGWKLDWKEEYTLAQQLYLGVYAIRELSNQGQEEISQVETKVVEIISIFLEHAEVDESKPIGSTKLLF
jgi:hypothetical protein